MHKAARCAVENERFNHLKALKNKEQSHKLRKYQINMHEQSRNKREWKSKSENKNMVE